MPGSKQGRATDQGSPADRRAAERLLVRVACKGGSWLPVLAATALILAAASIALPALIGRAIDAAVGDASTSWLVWLGLVVAILVACDAIEDIAAGISTAESTAWLRRLLFRHVLAVGPEGFDRFGTGDITSRLTGNAADAGRVGQDVIRAMSNAIPSLGGIVALGLIDPWLLFTFACGLPVLAALLRVFARTSYEVAEKYLAAQAAIASRLTEALSGSRTIAASGTVDRETERVLRGLPELHSHGLRMWRTQIRMSAQGAVVVSLLEVAVLCVAGVELSQGRITPGELVAASQYVLLAATLGHSSSALGRMGRDRAASKRIAEVLEIQPRQYGTGRLPAGQGRLDFRQVTIAGDQRAALDRIDLTIPGGLFVALVGKSGSGKSLLAATAGRLVDPDSGAVMLDGVPLESLGHDDLRSAITYGFERPALVGTTISDAIALGVTRPARDAIAAAARAARADLFISHLPRGYATPLSEAPMSGGERQRLGLARAFANAGRVLVFDDVAASLDTVTEHEISDVLTTVLRDRTRLVVAHRASTAAKADLVVWLDDGQIRSVGPHHELWRDPSYRSLYSAEGEVGSVADQEKMLASP